jgi:DNA-binding response OmpR family regulator
LTRTNIDTITIGSLEVDPYAYMARFDGQEVELSATEVEILATLASNTAKVSSRSELAEAIGLRERTIDVVISALRQKITPELIRNVRGRGWILNRRTLQT